MLKEVTLRYFTTGHFSGNARSSVDVTAHLPWLYVIYCVRDRLIYVGETNDRSGLISRIGSHFGSANSSLRQAANDVGSVRSLKPPFVVVAAELPTDEPTIRFDSSSKGVRLLMEGVVHHRLALYATENEWNIISTSQPGSFKENSELVEACASIVDCFCATIGFTEGITEDSPFNFVTLGWRRDNEDSEDIGRVLNRMEVTLCRFVIACLQSQFGDKWWASGVPEETRKACAGKQEEEPFSELPKEAYLTLIDLRKIVDKNWSIFQEPMQRLSGKSGRGRATGWIVEVNDLRKTWAHPIKQIYAKPISDDQRKWVQSTSIELHALAAGPITGN